MLAQNVSNAITEHVTPGLHGPHTHHVSCACTRTPFYLRVQPVLQAISSRRHARQSPGTTCPGAQKGNRHNGAALTRARLHRRMAPTTLG